MTPEPQMFILQRRDGTYVAPSTSRKAYVSDPMDARAFRNRTHAERERDEEETIVDVVALLKRLKGTWAL